MAGKANKVRSRFYSIVQYEVNPLTGESLGFNEARILAGIDLKDAQLKAWAYIKHDKDAYIDGDDIPEGKSVGDVRPAHWHVMLQFNNQVEVGSVSKAFGVEPQYVDKMTGATAFFDGVYYMTHEDQKQQELGKHVYDRGEVKMPKAMVEGVWAQIDQLVERRLHKLPVSMEVEQYIKKLASGEITLEYVFKENPVVYTKNLSVFKQARQGYLRLTDPPMARVNYYLSGGGGSGKTIAAKALARSLYPGKPDNEVFFIVSDGNIPFDGYDGQPVIIWDDWRSGELLSKFDRGMVWKLFATNPDRINVNIKYGSVNLINSVNILTSVVPFMKFMESLASEYKDSKGIVHPAEDATQGYRRFPVFLEITRESYELYVTQALSDGEFDQYKHVCTVEASFKRLAENLTPENQRNYLTPVIDTHEEATKYIATVKEVELLEPTIIYHEQ